MTFAITNTFVNGTTADALEVNENFTDVENELNGVTNTATPAWNNLVLIRHTAATGASSFDFTDSLTSYKAIMIVWDLKTDTNGKTINLRLNNDSTENHHHYVTQTNAVFSAVNNTLIVVAGNDGGASPARGSGYAIIPIKYDWVAGNKIPFNISSSVDTFSSECPVGQAFYEASADLNRITFLANTGNLSGWVSLFGIRNG